MSEGAMIQSLANVREFALAGNARFTVVSKRTGQRRTFRVRANRDDPNRAPQGDLLRRPTMWFVDLLVGPSNEDDYRYVGYLRAINDLTLVYSQNKKGFALDAGRVVRWLAGYLNSVGSDLAQSRFLAECEFWHEGRCGRCGRTLTDPESIKRGIGPVCDGKEGS